MLSPMNFKGSTLDLIDQRVLPHKEIWITYSDLEQIAVSIEKMVVRGAPAIGCTAAFALAVDAAQFDQSKSYADYQQTFTASVNRLARTRPTAVNLFYALNLMKKVAQNIPLDEKMSEVTRLFSIKSTEIYECDIQTCKAIGEHGAAMAAASSSLSVITHCNAGALATAGYGTAVGVLSSLHKLGKLKHVFVDETRPWLQGSRLTAFEMARAGIDHSLICDSVAAHIMKTQKVDWVVVGADRIAANGDAANKIGTYSLAVNAKYHGVEFYVAAPFSTFDLNLSHGGDIPIEERDPDEVRRCMGDTQISDEKTPVKNPSFDVTPAELITGIITENGVITHPTKDLVAQFFSKIGRRCSK